MSIEVILAIAEENHWVVEYTTDGEIVLFTGVEDEAKRTAADAESVPEWDEETIVEDPLTT